MTALATFEATFQKDEQWVVTELANGWQDLENAIATVAVDVESVFGWIQAHQSTILSVFQGVLTGVAAIGSVLPGAAPLVTTATTAIDAATAAIDVLSQGLTAGSTPMSTLSNAYALTKQASSAVNAVLTQVSAPQTPAQVAAGSTPVAASATATSS
jgi:hypothetical protein